jgi:hypothetical protein
MDPVVRSLVTVFTKGDAKIVQALLNMVGIRRWSCITHTTWQGFDCGQVLTVGLGQVLTVHEVAY